MALALLLALVAGTSQPAQAADFAVTRTDDPVPDGCNPGDCSLREAIVAANGSGGPDTVTLPAGTYTLSIVGANEDAAADGDLDVTEGLTITGAGAATTIIDGNGAVTGERVFHVDPAGAGIIVDISGVTIRNGTATGTARGGGIHHPDWSSVGSLTLTDVTVTSNAAFNGAGIANDGGTLTVNNSTISGNATTGNAGGGIVNDSGTLALNNSTVTGNSAASGGGIYNARGTVTMDKSVLDGNTATSDGGGIVNSGGLEGPAGPLTITDSTISGNTADDRGGGIHNDGGGTVTITDSTLSGNTGFTAGGGISNGLVDSPGTLTLTNVTISGNAGSSGAGINVFLGSTATLTNVTISGNQADVGGGITSGGTATLTNTIVANSVSGSDCNGAITSNGNNLDSDGTCGLGAGELPNTDPSLGPLADNGGPTETHALLSGSPAIDAGDDAACPATDQRGVARLVDGDANGTATCDIGAYEYEPPPPTPTPTPAPSPTPTPAELPPTGGDPGSDSGVPTVPVLLLVTGVLGLAGVGSALMGRWQRR